MPSRARDIASASVASAATHKTPAPEPSGARRATPTTSCSRDSAPARGRPIVPVVLTTATRISAHLELDPRQKQPPHPLVTHRLESPQRAANERGETFNLD